MKDISLIHIHSKIHLISRVIVMVLIYVLYTQGGFFEEEFFEMLRTLSVVSIFYGTAFIAFMVRYPYPVATDKAVRRVDIGAVIVLVGCYGIYAALMLLSAFKPSWVGFNTLMNVLWIGEVLFALVAALSLPNILQRFPLR
ncbi:MAG: hypothetical protein R8G66_22160 [Cytophagales bacterium]|nr:hypothetical protein [Cytophagales bacterium]